MSEKIQKVLAHLGMGSRREIERWINEGRVYINGRQAKLGTRVDLTAKITVDNKQVNFYKILLFYILCHDCICILD